MKFLQSFAIVLYIIFSRKRGDAFSPRTVTSHTSTQERTRSPQRVRGVVPRRSDELFLQTLQRRWSVIGTSARDEDAFRIEGVRLNKALKATHSRRQADKLITEGRVQVNGSHPDSMGVRLFPGDVVMLDGQVVDWERLNSQELKNTVHDVDGTHDSGDVQGVHTYIKYWKPRGIECTTDRRVDRNIMDALGPVPGVKDRLWPMGRLDKDSTGLILLTSDGQTTQRVLKSESEKVKTYLVETNHRASDSDIRKMAEGVRILSHTSRDGKTKTQWVTTKSAVVERGPQSRVYERQLLFKISEGKNRQIRRMCETVGLRVTRLHRIDFAGVTLDGCIQPGSWKFLTDEEIRLLKGL